MGRVILAIALVCSTAPLVNSRQREVPTIKTELINPKGIKKMTYKIDVSDFVTSKVTTIHDLPMREIQGTVQPALYSLVLACFYDARAIGPTEPITPWIGFGGLEIDYEGGQKTKVSFYYTGKLRGAFLIATGSDETKYRGGNDAIFINTIVSIHQLRAIQYK